MFQGSEKEKSRWEQWKERMKHTYRLVLMNNETFEEVGSYRLNLLNVYLLASTIIVVLAVLVYLLIAFTPLKKYIPGYNAALDHHELQLLSEEVERLESELAAQLKYTENFKKVLVGDLESVEDVESEEENTEAHADTTGEVTANDIDAQMRQEIELAEIGAIAQRGRPSNNGSKSLPLEQLYFLSPVRGEISAGFMPDEGHQGVDILAPKNTAIKAVMDGYVFLSDWTLETGNTIGIQHTNNLITFYKHNSALLKKAGSFVKAGEAVAIIGNTGTLTDGPHLHFELWYKGNAVDPADYISF